MYIRVELATNAPTVASSAIAEQPAIRPAQHHPAAGDRDEVHRRVHQQPELLIEQQPEHAARDVRDEDVELREIAVRDLRIEHAVEHGRTSTATAPPTTAIGATSAAAALGRAPQRAAASAATIAARRTTNFVCSHGRIASARPRQIHVRARAGSGAYSHSAAHAIEQRAGNLRKDQPGVRHERHGEADGRPRRARPAAVRPAAPPDRTPPAPPARRTGTASRPRRGSRRRRTPAPAAPADPARESSRSPRSGRGAGSRAAVRRRSTRGSRRARGCSRSRDRDRAAGSA